MQNKECEWIGLISEFAISSSSGSCRYLQEKCVGGEWGRMNRLMEWKLLCGKWNWPGFDTILR